MVDSGSPVTIIGYDELQKILQYVVLFVRPLPKDEKYVDFNKQPVDLLLKEGHIVKVDEIRKDVFLQPTVITVKKDRSIKIALDTRELNRNVVKDKYPIPNSGNLMDMIAEHVAKKTGQTFSTTLDMTYVYGQVELSIIDLTLAGI